MIMLLISSVISVHAINTTVSGVYNGYRYSGELSLTQTMARMELQATPKDGAVLLPITVEVNGNARAANDAVVRIYERIGGEYCEDAKTPPAGSYFVSAVGEYIIDRVTVDESELYL